MKSWKWKPGWSGWNKLKDFDTGSSSVSADLCDWLCHNNQILLRIRLSLATRLLWLCPALSRNTNECRVESCWYTVRDVGCQIVCSQVYWILTSVILWNYNCSKSEMCQCVSMITTAWSGQRITQLFEFNYKSTNIFISTVKCSNPGYNSITDVSYCTCYSHGLYRSRVTGSDEKHGDFSQDVSVLCYYTASLISFVRVLVIWNALNQRIIWWQSLNERNGFCTVCSHLLEEKCLSIVPWLVVHFACGS